MTGRLKFILSIFGIVAMFILIIVVGVLHIYSQKSTRTSTSLLNQYYRLSAHDPEQAKRALDIILIHDPTNQIALREMGYWYLRQGDIKGALKQFQSTHRIYPEDAIVNNQLHQIYTLLGQKEPAATHEYQSIMSMEMMTTHFQKNIFHIHEGPANHWLSQSLELCHYQDHPIKESNESILCNFASKIESSRQPSASNVKKMNDRDKMLNEFYQNRKTNPRKAWTALSKLLRKYPNDLIALKEASYFLLNENKKEESLTYFIRAYRVSCDTQLALQIAYILDGLDRKREAYYYFDLATQTTNLKERLKAELAKTNLRGVQTRFLPNPYYINLLFYPFYQSRFKLLIYPLIAKAGVVLNKTYNVTAYVIYRRTSDNKSTGSGVLPQIYEDNAAITSIGIQATPFPKIPISAFIEAGKAIDIVYKDRARWRNDFRTGLLLYDEWGKEARYTFSPHFTWTPNMDIYGDLVYYSRYLNTIGTLRIRPGFEIFRYGSASLNLYMKAFLSQDDSRLFYNNIFEFGPSLAFTPCDRYNITIRYENLRGLYLHAGGGPGPNPYSKNYHNNMLFLDTYVGF